MKRMAKAFVGFGCIGLPVLLQGQLCAAGEADVKKPELHIPLN